MTQIFLWNLFYTESTNFVHSRNKEKNAHRIFFLILAQFCFIGILEVLTPLLKIKIKNENKPPVSCQFNPHTIQNISNNGSLAKVSSNDIVSVSIDNDESLLTLYKKEIREVWNLLAHQYNLSTQLKTTLSHPKVPCAMNIFIILYFKPKPKKIKIIHDQCTLNIPSTWKCGIRTNFITVTKEIDIQSRFWRALWNLLWTEEQSHMVFKSSQISKSSEPYCTWYFRSPIAVRNEKVD